MNSRRFASNMGFPFAVAALPSAPVRLQIELATKGAVSPWGKPEYRWAEGQYDRLQVFAPFALGGEDRYGVTKRRTRSEHIWTLERTSVRKGADFVVKVPDEDGEDRQSGF
jgi:hypothetical protein